MQSWKLTPLLIPLDLQITARNLQEMSPKIRQERKRGIPGEMRQALDPFFLFTYTLLGIAAVIQILVIVWMDVF